MSISSGSARVCDLGLTRPYAIAGRVVTAVQNVLVRVSDGRVEGFGVGAPSPAVTGETIAGCLEACEAFLDGLSRRDMDEALATLRTPEARARARRAPAAMAAVEMAVLDLIGRVLDRPVARLLGAQRARLRTSVTIGILPLEEALAEADRLIRQGFRAIKLKIGNDVEADIELVCRLRDRLAPDVGLRVDANQGYDVEGLARFDAATAHVNLELIEQPLPRGQWAALAPRLSSRVTPLAADEDLHGVDDAVTLAQKAAPYDVFNIKLMKCGGVRNALTIGEISGSQGIHLMWGCMDESRISIAAALSAALSCANTRFLDLDGSFDLASDVAWAGFALRDGDLMLTDAPGLGVVIEEVW